MEKNESRCTVAGCNGIAAAPGWNCVKHFTYAPVHPVSPDSPDLAEARSELQALKEENERLKAEQRRIRGELGREGLLRMVNAQATQIGELQARLQKDDKVVGMADAIDFDREIEKLTAQLSTARDAALEEAAKVCDAASSEFDSGDDASGCAEVCGERIRALKGKGR